MVLYRPDVGAVIAALLAVLGVGVGLVYMGRRDARPRLEALGRSFTITFGILLGLTVIGEILLVRAGGRPIEFLHMVWANGL
jgi:hypothetical protein